MEIQLLKVTVSEADVNEHLPRVLPPGQPVQNLRLRFTPEGVVLQGDYPTMLLKMAFETLWEVSAAGTKVQARLANVKVAGLPAGLLRGVLLKSLRDATAHDPALRIDGDLLVVDVCQALRARGLPLQITLTAIRTGPGTITIEAGPPPPAH